jgi:hypothetical protein
MGIERADATPVPKTPAAEENGNGAAPVAAVAEEKAAA